MRTKINLLNQLKQSPTLTTVGVAVVAFFLFKILTTKIGNRTTTVTYAVKSTNLTDSQASAYAEQLYQAMQGYGRDQLTITRIYDICKNDVGGLGKIYNAFGVRDYGFFGAPVLNPFKSKLDLQGWFRKELPTNTYVYWDSLFTQLNSSIK